MKIIAWDTDDIYFSDSSFICYEHEADCCEYNYADFGVLSTFYHGEEFSSVFIEAKEKGFLLHLRDVAQFKQFGETMKIWIPCYSDQSGYYSADLTVFYCDKKEHVIQRIDLWSEIV